MKQRKQNPNSHHELHRGRSSPRGCDSNRDGGRRDRRKEYRESDPPSRFHDLPPDLLLRIAAAFDAGTLRSAGSVCRSWFGALQPLREAILLFRWGKRFRHGTSGGRGGSYAVRRDPVKALDAFVKAAGRGLPMAMVDAGLMYWEMGRKKEGMGMYRRAAELGHPAGMCNLAIAYLEGETPELEKAVDLFYRSAMLGYGKAQYNLALCLQHGRGVKRDMKEAAAWYLRAAEGGNVRAMYNVSLCHSLGEELPQNHKEALNWLELAANCGHGKAQLELGNHHFLAGNKAKAFFYLELASRSGETDANRSKDQVLRSLSESCKERIILSVNNWHPRRMHSR